MARVLKAITLCVDCSYYQPCEETEGIQPSCWHAKAQVDGRGVLTNVAIPDWCPLPAVFEEPEPLGVPPFKTTEEWDQYRKNEQNWSYVARNAVSILSAAISNMDLTHKPSGLRDMTHDHHDQPKEEDLDMSALMQFILEFLEGIIT